ncbi:MAG: cation:proton antiporter [Gemmatirosa sp.]|nr:cation:proton antiporter [Gemmatirosa sp.]
MPDLALLLAQLLVILAAGHAAGWLARRLGQSAIIGEIAAGLALGPSLFGAIAPTAAAALFPANGVGALSTLSQIGVVLFMFVVGLRLDMGLLRGQARVAIATSQASIVVPFALGLALAPRLFPAFAGPQASARTFALFVGASLSVTAFPVLARILGDRDMTRTPLGAFALASAAADDVSAWCMLAGVIAAARAGDAPIAVATTIVSIALYAATALVVARPILRRFAPMMAARGRGAVIVGVLIALASALATERLGVHALFGAFLAGAIVPRDEGVAERIAATLDPVVSPILLPVFFAFTGLRTSLALVDGAGAWWTCGLVFLAAVAGKLGGSAVAARTFGSSWREALSIGVLLNTRGLMELVILNAGLDAGIISPTLFTMMVLMALATTAMTSPLLSLLGARAWRTAVS